MTVSFNIGAQDVLDDGLAGFSWCLRPSLGNSTYTQGTVCGLSSELSRQSPGEAGWQGPCPWCCGKRSTWQRWGQMSLDPAQVILVPRPLRPGTA